MCGRAVWLCLFCKPVVEGGVAGETHEAAFTMETVQDILRLLGADVQGLGHPFH
jgi:hypothetical protein